MNNDLKILKSANGKKILVIGVFHGDEPQGEYFINEYLKNPPQDNKNSLYFIPRLNKNNKRVNKNGVDLNRNFPAKNWCKSKKDDYFGGDSPASEEETKMLVDIIEKNDFSAVIAIHAPYKIVNYDGPAQNLAKKISEIVGYPVEGDIGYPTPGSFGTYCGIEKQIPAITIEVDENAPLDELYLKFKELFNYLAYEY